MYMYAYEQETMVIFNGDAKSEGGGVVDKVMIGMVKRSFCCLKKKEDNLTPSSKTSMINNVDGNRSIKIIFNSLH